jgi:CRISPR system Cascade subunit CasB
MTTTPSPIVTASWGPAAEAVARRLGPLQAMFLADVPSAVAETARLRRNAGRDVLGSADTWGLDGLEQLAQIMGDLRERGGQNEWWYRRYYLPDVPRHLREARESAAENAVHLTVTLWAMHQQSVRDTDMYVSGWSLGRAVRRLALGRTGVPTTEEKLADRKRAEQARSNRTSGRTDAEQAESLDESVRKRFVRAGVTDEFASLAVRLRDLVSLLRTARIPLDYPRLADQLCQWQDDDLRANVRRTWGREFHRSIVERYEPTRAASGGTDDTGAGI